VSRMAIISKSPIRRSPGKTKKDPSCQIALWNAPGLSPLDLEFIVVNLCADDLYQDPFFSTTVEFTVKDLLPGAEIKLTISDRNNHFPSHYLPF